MLPGQVIDRRYLLRKYNGSKLLLVADLHLGFDIGLSSRFDNREPRWSYDIIDKLKINSREKGKTLCLFRKPDYGY
ncbi:MAG: hypothetical protein ACXACU_08340 [Candidatus Hodarchaeales archaeon]